MIFPKVEKCCCFTLSFGCFLLGLVYAVWQVYILGYTVPELTRTKSNPTIFQTIVSSVALFTTLLMMIGCLLGKRLLILFHIMSELMVVIYDTIWTIMILHEIHSIYFTVTIIMMIRQIIIYAFTVVHCIVMLSLAEEIEECE